MNAVPATVTVRRLLRSDAHDYRTIRLSALRTAPDAFGSTHAIEAAQPIEKMAERLTSWLVFGAYDGGRIVGMMGLLQDTGPKDAHKGHVWGVFVEPGSRNRGVGAALMAALVAAAREVVEQLLLSVVERNTEAVALYERFGFIRYGTEPRALKSGARYFDEVLMILVLDAAAQDRP